MFAYIFSVYVSICGYLHVRGSSDKHKAREIPCKFKLVSRSEDFSVLAHTLHVFWGKLGELTWRVGGEGVVRGAYQRVCCTTNKFSFM